MKYHVFETDELELNLLFLDTELKDFVEMWQVYISLENMAKKMWRKPSELALLIFDHAERGIIKKRHQGVYGI